MAAADDVTTRAPTPEDGPGAATEGDGESDDDETAPPSERGADSESNVESSPGSSPESSPELRQKHGQERSLQSSPEVCQRPSSELSPAPSPGASPAGSPTLGWRCEPAADSRYTSDGEEKGSGRDPDGGQLGRPAECRNTVLGDRSEHADCSQSPHESVESAESVESESTVPLQSVESPVTSHRAEEAGTAARAESPAHPLSEAPADSPSEDPADPSEDPSERREPAEGPGSCADSRLELVPPDSDVSTDDEGGGAVSRFLRASMRKMFHFRLSSRGLRRRSSASQPSQSSPTPSTRTAMETRAARAARRTSDEQVCCSPAGDDTDSPPPGQTGATGGGQTIRMSTLLDRLNGAAAGASSVASSAAGSAASSAAGTSGVAAGPDLIQVSTREPHLHDAPLPALEESESVSFDTPPPPPLPAPSPIADRPAASSSRANRLLSRGSSFLGVYQTVPELSDQEETRRAARGFWQHNYSSPLACLSCTIGLGAICRFALFGGTYGVAFVIQFFILSLLVGMPLMTLHMTMGQYIGSGIVDMWRISPIFKGIGLAAVLAELILGVYTVVPISWMLVYLRDSFVSSYDRYKWAACPGNCSVGYAELVTYTVPQYFNQRVLQRNMSGTGLPEVGYLGFEISFNLAVTWILVYLSLGRGLRSYGKVVYAIVLLAMVSFFTVCIQLLSWTEGLNEFFTDKVLFDNVFWSTVPWVVAARETFMIWGLHGAALMAVTSHNKFNHNLRRDTTLVAFVTLVVLFLSALFGYACLHALRVGDIGYIIGSSSFETEQRSRFLIAPGIGSSHSGGTPPEVKHYTNLVSGVIIKLSAASEEGTVWSSGYQVHRLATELFPSLLAVLAIWRAVVEAVISVCPAKMRSWELTTTFIVCVTGFGLSLPLMTEIGIHIIYFLDYCVGCLWWLVVIYVLEVSEWGFGAFSK
ncbi:Sodium- and chloride-dependent GABA transporter 1 [Amphibalanus amphitrite]|uniref:Sodium-and chloride-dependent GABA transporter 1 n=1 Tax=Amphibalanus amphitrite TaxID=1232801 RepID=A0A6A4X867_AMPAM|nr:Sodium- and chloride-dependent GABA transporter 1 [Amphibalanus amphitrite]